MASYFKHTQKDAYTKSTIDLLRYILRHHRDEYELITPEPTKDQAYALQMDRDKKRKTLNSNEEKKDPCKDPKVASTSGLSSPGSSTLGGKIPKLKGDYTQKKTKLIDIQRCPGVPVGRHYIKMGVHLPSPPPSNDAGSSNLANRTGSSFSSYRIPKKKSSLDSIRKKFSKGR